MTADTVTTELRYFIAPPNGERPWQFINADAETGVRKRNFTTEEFKTEIENVRGKEDQYGLDTAGFQFFNVPTTVKDFSDDEKIKEVYYHEQAELIKKLTGANRVVMFDHTIRRHKPDDLSDTPDNRHPVSQVHVDQTPTSAEARVNRHLPVDIAPKLLEKRFQIINLWRPISHYAIDYPLSLCDWRSVDSSGLLGGKGGDLTPTTLKYDDRDGETFSVKYNSQHRWKYLKGMDPDEGVLIKCYDSIADGSVARLTPHTAFIDPTTPAGAPLRQSIELRALVFYE